ncbi:hypothetical protein KJ713_01620 [Patescibacteria group bacterium]|nr:hypothetical protein [Patescibacteria group bacterium]
MDRLSALSVLLPYPHLKSGVFAWLAGEWWEHGGYLLYCDQEWFSNPPSWPGIPFGVKQNSASLECLLNEESRALLQKASDYRVL